MSTTRNPEGIQESLVPSASARSAGALLSLRYYIIRLMSCPIPGLPSAVPVIGGKTAVELIATAATVGLGVVLAGTSGGPADILCALTILLCMRFNILTLLLGISFERAIYWHKVMAVTATIAVGLHAGAKGSNSTGIGIITCMCIAAAAYFVKPYWFELFYYVHILSYIAILPMVMKHFSAKYFTYACAFWGIDLILRYVITQHKRAMTAQILPGDVIRLKCKKPFNYHAGQYCFLLIPDIHKIEFHPFSFSSAPNDEDMVFHIRELGDWTKKLGDHIRKCSTEQKVDTIELDVYIEGPYGTNQIDLNSAKYEVVLLISGGIGITPMQSLQQDLVKQVMNGRAMRKVIVVWSVKDRAMIDAMQFQNSGNRDAYLPLSFQPPMQPPPRIRSERISPGREDQDGLEAGADSNDMQRINSKYVFFNEFYMTQVRSADDFNAADINPEVQKWLKFGRPNLDELFARVKEMCMVENISRVGVCVCGPAPLVADVRDRCSKTLLKPSQGTVRFDCHSELFDF